MTYKQETKGKEYYESRGLSRYTMILSKDYKAKLDDAASKLGIPQGNLIEVFLDVLESNEQAFSAALDAKAETISKIGRPAGRVKQKDIIDLLKGMTPAQLEAAQQAMLKAKAIEA